MGCDFNSITIQRVMNTLLIFHVVTMLIAWTVLAPGSILLARYGRLNQAASQHRAMQVVVVLFTIIGWAFALTGNEQRDVGHFVTSNEHHVLGALVVFWTIAHPIHSIAYPFLSSYFDPQTSYLIWNIFHKWSGRFLLLVAVATTITGLFQPSTSGSVAISSLVLVSIILTGLTLAIGLQEYRRYVDCKTLTTTASKTPNASTQVTMQGLWPTYSTET